jgi:nitroreductase
MPGAAEISGMNLGVTVIKSRRSVRKYKPDLVPDAAVHDALECARLAPTARNAQPWQIAVLKDKETLTKISRLARHGRFIADAPVCFAVFGRDDHPFVVEDCCAATAQLILGLWAHGVGSCWVAGYQKDYGEDIRKLLGVPDEYLLISLIPAGFPAEMPRPSKLSLEDIVFYDSWEPVG